jgi:hypothetical protein
MHWDLSWRILLQQLYLMAVIVPTLNYASENWTINLSDKKKIESAEMKFLRSVAGYTLLDQKRSTDVRKELKIFNLSERKAKRKLVTTDSSVI